MLQFDDGRPFSSGSAQALMRPTTERETADKLFLRVRIDGILETEAAVDTGGLYVLCSPEAASLLDLASADAVATEKLSVRGVMIAGDLHRVSLRILSDEGLDVVIDATALVPRLRLGASWGLPDVILGWHGCLERMRFAVDPIEGMVYFGSEES